MKVGMVVAAQRAYSDAFRWIKAARPAPLNAWRVAWRAYWSSFAAGCGVSGVIALIAPSQFGQVGTNTLHTGVRVVVIVAVVAAVALATFLRRRQLVTLVVRVREPFARPLSDHSCYEGASGALASCPAPFRARFALALVWGPAVVAVLAGACAFSTSYFLLDSILTGGDVGWASAAYAAAFFVIGVIGFRLATPRLTTWPLATSVYKDVSASYV